MKIIGISGRKQSGKNTVANFISGDILQGLNMVQDFTLDQDGNLKIKTSDANGNTGWGIFDLLRKDSEFISYAESQLWPYVKIYHFADYLKKICVDLFGLTESQVYGSDEDKNTETSYNMTAREFLQYFGTDIMRKIKDNIWVEATIKTINQEQSLVSLIPDVRFPNEIEAIHKAGGVVVRLTRDVHGSTHHCESSLDKENFDWSFFDHIIENENGTVEDLISKLKTIKHIWE